MTSTIPQVKAALVTILGGVLPNTQVIYGPINAVTTSGPRVLVVGRAVGRRDLDSLGLSTAAERYVVELTASADLSGVEQQSADEMALSDYITAESAIRLYAGGADLGLSAAGVLSVLPTGDFELVEQADDTGKHAVVRFSVAVIAQTT